MRRAGTRGTRSSWRRGWSIPTSAPTAARAAFAALVEAYDAFAPSDIKYDISQAEFQGDALTTAAWMWDDAAAAARRHKARHTLEDVAPSSN